METQLKFTKSVGQVISGAATFSAPQTFNQTNNVTLSAEALDVRPLLLRQRVNIANRVDAIAKLDKIQPDVIYRILVEDYGAESVGGLARGHYASIVADLDEWLHHAQGIAAKLKRARKAAGGTWVAVSFAAMVGGLVAGAIFLGYVFFDVAQLRCHWNGKAFSVGSVTTMTHADVYQCIYDPDAYERPYWVPAGSDGSLEIPG